jgi:iron(III) transport system ATP-binding protein
MTAALRLESVSKRFHGRAGDVLDRVSFEVQPGEICALLGPSGTGKTTLLRIVAGFEKPDAGRVFIGDREVASAARQVVPEHRGIGFVHQAGALFPHLTVADNVTYGLHKMSSADRSARWKEIARLCGLEAFENRYPHQLSGGEQQRVSLARALAPGAALVCLDEPLSNVDPQRRYELGDELRRILKESGTTALLVTHDQEEAFAISDRLGILAGGTLVQIGEPEEVYRRPASAFVADFLGHASFLRGVARQNTIATEIGEFHDSAKHAEGSELRILLRPGDCVLEADLAGNAVVESARYCGEHWVYEVRLASGSSLRCDIDAVPYDVLRPGQRVRVVPRTNEAVAFEAAPSAS